RRLPPGNRLRQPDGYRRGAKLLRGPDGRYVGSHGDIEGDGRDGADYAPRIRQVLGGEDESVDSSVEGADQGWTFGEAGAFPFGCSRPAHNAIQGSDHQAAHRVERSVSRYLRLSTGRTGIYEVREVVEPDYEQCEISWITKAFCAHCLGVEADF